MTDAATGRGIRERLGDVMRDYEGGEYPESDIDYKHLDSLENLAEAYRREGIRQAAYRIGDAMSEGDSIDRYANGVTVMGAIIGELEDGD